MTRTWLVAAGLGAAVLTIAACGSSGSPSGAGTSGGGSGASVAPAAASSSTLKTATINGVTVLTNAKGFTLYWFAPDTPTSSKCNGSCATYWPPVKGPVTAGAAGVTGKLSVITRADGSKQATYNGHPLYTYSGDAAPGQAKGNGLNLSGGVWHEVTASGAAAPAASHSSSSGGGYGY